MSSIPSVFAVLALGASAAGAAEPLLVADIDNTGDPYFEDCGGIEPCTQIPYFGGQPAQLTAWGDLLFFVANDREHGFEPWVSDGTEAGTRMLADLCPGDCESMAVFVGPTPRGVLFWAFDPGVGCRLWRSDGDSVIPFGEVAGGSDSCLPWVPGPLDTLGYPAPSAAFGGYRFFDTGVSARNVLLRSDGTAAGTEEVFEICSRQPTCFEILRESAVAGGALYFVTAGDSDGADLWRLDEPAGAPVLVWEAPSITDLVALEGELLFVAGNPIHGEGGVTHLYRTDGTPEGTAVVREFGSPAGCLTGGGPWGPEGLARLGKQVFLRAHGCGAWEIWRSDGTPEGTLPVATHPLISFDEHWSFLPFAPVPGGLQFGATLRGDQKPDLFQVDAAGNVLHLIGPIADLTAVDGRTFFSVDEERTGAEPWISDGLAVGTAPLADLEPGTGSSSPDEFTRAGDLVFFAAETAELGRELWAVAVDDLPTPQPPFDEWITSEEAPPGFRFQVRITAPGAAGIEGRREADCQPDTVCVSGQLPGRSEVYLRVLGPRPNGYWWPTITRFTPSQVEVWVQRLNVTEELRYYRLETVGPGEEDLPGRQDRTGFAASS